MDGLGTRKDIFMYHYVLDKVFLKRAQSCCSGIMKELENRLRKKYGINAQCFLVGSGGRNLVTQNANGKIDFDYNFHIISSENWNERYLKESVRKTLNEILREHGLGTCSDSTSALTTRAICFDDDRRIEFSMDICIVCKDEDGNWNRLIHKKTGFTSMDRYYWNIAPHSAKTAEKAKIIKQKPGRWELVREEYLRLKNLYLTRNDDDHPSFICYIEAVNNIYNRI